MAVNKRGDNLLVAAYSRTISRPDFWQLNPFRLQISEYAFMEGNPDLRPAYSNNVSLTFVYKSATSVSLGYDVTSGQTGQITSIDADNPNVTIVRTENMNNTVTGHLSFVTPVKIAKWWTLTTNLTGIYRKLEYNGVSLRKPMLYVNISSNVTLPWKLIFETQGWWTSGQIYGNMSIASMGVLNVSLKRTFLSGSLTASLGANNILDTGLNRVTTSGEGFVTRINNRYSRPEACASLRYNFKAGKNVPIKRVEQDNDQNERIQNQ
jgi:outer membrane receptor protein involved in Fe transport